MPENQSVRDTRLDNFLLALQKSGIRECYTDELHLSLYATDASLYEVQPLAVAIPQNENELTHLIHTAHHFKIPVLPRGSATSLAGQTVNRALIIDFTKYFDRILDIQPDLRYARVQPGVTRDQLNKAAAPYKLHFAPDPATTGRATFGGMIANNSSGTKSILYGKTIDHVLELKIMLMDGTIMHLHALTEEALEQKCRQNDREGEIYRSFRTLIFDHSEAISAAYPKVMRRVSGYPLDEFVHTNEWNLAKLLCGSEGTLAIILEAKVRLEPVPAYKAAVTVHYSDRMDAIRSVRDIVGFAPAAVEMLDYHVFELSAKHPLTSALHQRLIQGNPQATLSVEFFCESEEALQARLQSFLRFIPQVRGVYAWPVLQSAGEQEDSWSLRKNGLGLIMGDPDGRKPIPFIEDMAIPLEHLADYIEGVLSICRHHGVDTVLYAHASVGVLHVRPGLDMTKGDDIRIMKEITNEVFTLVKKYNGSWSGEHGDGRNRSPMLRAFFGEQVYQMLKEVKDLFDPDGLLNPGIIIDPEPMDTHLRYGAGYQDRKEDFVYQYRKDHSFNALVHNCSGVGACRNKSGGTMCPSFRATLNESDSTRGRANALRLALAGKAGFERLDDPKVLEVLDLCLSCKACKSECPSNVDMAKLKSEVLQKKYDKGIISLRERSIYHSAGVSAMLSGWPAAMVNYLQKTALFRKLTEKLLKIHSARILPDYASQTLESWYRKNYRPLNSDKKVALFADTYINYHEPHIGIEAIRLLNQCGFDTELAVAGCCQRPRISNGFLKAAKLSGSGTLENLDKYIRRGMKVVVCEPSCTTALTDDLPDLIEDEALAQRIQANVLALDVFIADIFQKGEIQGQFKVKYESLMMHGHCHQKSSFGTRALHYILDQADGLQYHEPDTGCCGMAGSFGYEKEHYDISGKIADLSLIPEINKLTPDTAIVANGFSCRHQISHFTDRKALHWVECVEFERK